MDPRRWREGERSLGEGVRRTPPVLARGVSDVPSKRGEGNSDLESLKLKAEEEEEEETPFDNIFFTFCCGDNLTCLKDSMVCDGSFDCPDGEDEVQCEREIKEEEEQPKKKEETFSNDLVSIHTKVAKEAKARLKEEAKVVTMDGRKAKVKRRRRLRKVIKETERDEKEEEQVMTKAEAETGRRKVRRRKKVRKESGANKQLLDLEDETEMEEGKENNFTEPNGDMATKTTEIPQFWDTETMSMTTESSQTEEPMKEVITELSTEKADHVGFERREGGRVLSVGGRKVRVNKRRRQKAPAMKSLPVLQSSSDLDASSKSLPSSSSSQLYSVEQLRQFLGQRPGQSQRQAANKGNEGEVPSDTESLVTTEFPAVSPARTPVDTTKSFQPGIQGTWIFDSFQTSKRKEKLPEAEVFKNPPLPGPALPPGFFASFDAQFV